MPKKTKDDATPRVDQIDRDIIRLKFTHRNLTLTEIGKMLPKPISKQAIHRRMQKPKFKAAWDDIEKDVIVKLKELQCEAVDVMRETMRSSNPKLRFQAAAKILEKVLLDADGLIPASVDEDEILEFIS